MKDKIEFIYSRFLELWNKKLEDKYFISAVIREELISKDFEIRYLENRDVFNFKILHIEFKNDKNIYEIKLEDEKKCPYKSELILEGGKWKISSFIFMCFICFGKGVDWNNDTCEVCGGEGWGVQ
ncbi:MAG: hypothetical protein NW226_11015 [Microscillaceae bacterium]|nr:hypothetical protein [Microscillaceae bacterium]